jgi:enoyl-CoA hydratase
MVSRIGVIFEHRSAENRVQTATRTAFKRRNEAMTYETILVEQRGRVGLITLNRPKALNALNAQLMMELITAAEAFDRSPETGCILITGSEKAFAAGADIKEMQSKTYMEAYLNDWFSAWDRLTAIRTPIVAAVAGFALGGGCELAMMCDIILAADTAKFGQPEIKLGAMPGMGGSQRLTRAIGKAKAAEMCLTGRMMDATEAERSGLVARVIPAAELLDDALKTAATIAGMSKPIAMMTKETLARAFESSLREGIIFERRLFHSMFSTNDQKEGMAAFVEKRPANFTNS